MSLCNQCTKDPASTQIPLQCQHSLCEPCVYNASTEGRILQIDKQVQNLAQSILTCPICNTPSQITTQQQEYLLSLISKGIEIESDEEQEDNVGNLQSYILRIVSLMLKIQNMQKEYLVHKQQMQERANYEQGLYQRRHWMQTLNQQLNYNISISSQRLHNMQTPVVPQSTHSEQTVGQEELSYLAKLDQKCQEVQAEINEIKDLRDLNQRHTQVTEDLQQMKIEKEQLLNSLNEEREKKASLELLLAKHKKKQFLQSQHEEKMLYQSQHENTRAQKQIEKNQSKKMNAFEKKIASLSQEKQIQLAPTLSLLMTHCPGVVISNNVEKERFISAAIEAIPPHILESKFEEILRDLKEIYDILATPTNEPGLFESFSGFLSKSLKWD